MSLFFINRQTTYLDRSQPSFRASSRSGKIWDFPYIARNKSYITNSELDAE